MNTKAVRCGVLGLFALAGLEVTAEPKITQAAIALLEQVTGQPRRPSTLPSGPASRLLLAAQPLAWWRLNEFAGPHACDASGHHRDAVYEAAIAYYLEGPHSAAFCGPGETNRAPHFVGGRLRARLPDLGDRYSVALWLWNGLPDGARAISGWFYSRDHDAGLSPPCKHDQSGQSSGSGSLTPTHRTLPLRDDESSLADFVARCHRDSARPHPRPRRWRRPPRR